MSEQEQGSHRGAWIGFWGAILAALIMGAATLIPAWITGPPQPKSPPSGGDSPPQAKSSPLEAGETQASDLEERAEAARIKAEEQLKQLQKKEPR
jgi:hypothetical protein